MGRYFDTELPFSTLIGKTITGIDGGVNSDQLRFHTSDGEEYYMEHMQDCCESVSIEDICGDLADLLNSSILQAEESTSDENPEGITKEYQDSFTWTFYRIATNKGSVVIRWYGESNGYYSESVNFRKVKSKQ